MWITNDGQWMAREVYTSVNRRSVTKIRLWRWHEDIGDWVRKTDVNHPVQLGQYFNLGKLLQFASVPNHVPEGWK